nr:glycosyltransferase family 25 protein [uncultured Devosia sp.]
MTAEAGESLLATFERVRIINLKTRTDRRRETSAEFARLGLPVDGGRVAFHEAKRPSDPGGFQTIGARGCFFSHLGILEAALDDGVENVLIVEDDLDFSRDAEHLLPAALGQLATRHWDVFYGGLLSCSIPAECSTDQPLSRASSGNGVMGAHFIAFSRAAVQLAVPYLNAIAKRPPGSPGGGPMHVDGAYSWLRQAHPELETWFASPELGHQRASRTDIHELCFIDRTPFIRDVATLARRMKRKFL